MEKEKQQIFDILNKVLNVANEILIMTQNQGTIIEYSDKKDVLDEIIYNKSLKIEELNELEDKFQLLYNKFGSSISDEADIRQLKNIVSKIVNTKKHITQEEENNRKYFTKILKTKVDCKPIKEPKSYVIEQYKKHSKL